MGMRIRQVLFILLFTSTLKTFAQVTSADIRIAYINKFTEYIEWQDESEIKNYSIGVFDNDEVMLHKFEYLASTRKIKNKEINIIHIENIEQLAVEKLHILYVSKENDDYIDDILMLVKERNTVLVTDNCQTKEALMINFLPSEKEEVVRYEINQKNMIDAGFIIHPDILLLGGTYIDVRKLFQEKEFELELEKQKLERSKVEVKKQDSVIIWQDKLIVDKENTITTQNGKINEQDKKLVSQIRELVGLSGKIEQKQVIFNERQKILKFKENQLIEKQDSIQLAKLELESYNEKIDQQELLINDQKNILYNQSTEIERQQNFLIGSFLFIILVISLGYFIYRSYRIKKKANIKLKTYNDEILAQNEEIKAQREELATARDILETTNQELEKVSIVASKTNNAVIISDSEGNIEWVNEGFTKLFGYRIEELVDKFGKNIVSASSYSRIEEKIQKCKNTKKTVEYFALNTTKLGEKLWMHTSITPTLDENGAIKKLIIIEANVTDLKRAEENILLQKEEIILQRDKLEEQKVELEKYRSHLENLVNERTKQLLVAKDKAVESDKLKSAFIANMSHEIRTPMNAVIGFSNLLALPNVTQKQASEYKSIINSNANSLVRLIDDIIDLSKIEAGKLVIKKANCALNSLMNDLYLVYKEKIKEADADIEINLLEPKETKTIIYSDKIRLNQVMINLLDNALKFTEKGRIDFGYKINSGKSIVFFVKDTGIGIEKSNQNMVFERFLKIEDDISKLYRGTGLGLSICKAIVTDLGGEIGVVSEFGVGSEFYFTIPIASARKLH